MATYNIVPMPDDQHNCADCNGYIPIGSLAVESEPDKWVHADDNVEYCFKVCYLCRKDCSLKQWETDPTTQETLCRACKDQHHKDEDCTVNPGTGLCTVCGANHGEQCPECGRKAFHTVTCWLVFNGNTYSNRHELPPTYEEVVLRGGACEDCRQGIANDDYTGSSDKQAKATRAGIWRYAQHGHHLVIGDEFLDFQTDRCAVCDGLPGDRWKVSYLKTTPEGVTPMDPNANLEEQIRLAQLIADGEMGTDYTVADVDRLAELVIGLNEWMAKGGFAPTAWKR